MDLDQLTNVMLDSGRLLDEAQLYIDDYHPQKLELLRQFFEQIEIHPAILEFTNFRETVSWKIEQIMGELDEIRGTPQYADVEWIASGLIVQMLTVQNIIMNMNHINDILADEDIPLMG